MVLILFLLLQAFSLFASVLPPPEEEQIYHQNMYDHLQHQQLQKQEKKSFPNVMTGNWGGARTYLQEHGFTIDMSYVTDMLMNPIGGTAYGFAYTGSFGLGVNLDFERACGWTGFEFFSSVIWRTGTNLSQKIGNQFPVSQVFGSETIKLNELYLKERLFDNRFILKAGRLNLGNDFLTSPLYGEYVNNAFDGNPISIFFNLPGISSLPNATWGAYLSFRPIQPLLAKFGVYNANTSIFKDRYHGINFTFANTNGVIWITEWTGLLNQGPKDSGMPGNYKVGLIYQMDHVQEFKGGAAPCNFATYILIDQMIYQQKGPGTAQSLTPFIALVFAPANRNEFPFFLNGGFVYAGPFSSRPDDVLNFGIAYGKYSSQQKPRQSFETVLELNYWFQCNDWFSFTPDLQYIINPKGLGKIQNTFVIGAQIGFVL